MAEEGVIEFLTPEETMMWRTGVVRMQHLEFTQPIEVVYEHEDGGQHIVHRTAVLNVYVHEN
jgi:hypothetical protein